MAYGVSSGYSPSFTCPACGGHEYVAWWKDGEHQKCKWCSQAKVDAAERRLTFCPRCGRRTTWHDPNPDWPVNGYRYCAYMDCGWSPVEPSKDGGKA